MTPLGPLFPSVPHPEGDALCAVRLRTVCVCVCTCACRACLCFCRVAHICVLGLGGLELQELCSNPTLSLRAPSSAKLVGAVAQS